MKGDLTDMVAKAKALDWIESNLSGLSLRKEADGVLVRIPKEIGASMTFEFGHGSTLTEAIQQLREKIAA
jgi:hypothetical protein